MSRYQSRLSGPLLDRIDLQVEVQSVSPAELLRLPEGEPSTAVAHRVAEARERQRARQGRCNSELEAADLAAVTLASPAERLLQVAAERLGWSGRGLHRALKVARTVADLDGSAAITEVHVGEALQYRRGLPAS